MILRTTVNWQFEDELPVMSDKEYNSIYAGSKVISGTRMFPYITINQEKVFLNYAE